MTPPTWKALAIGLAAVLLILFVGYACGWELPT
jgi:hypothetical protein